MATLAIDLAVKTRAAKISGDKLAGDKPVSDSGRADSRARRYDPAETRQRVLAAANMLFATNGYSATGTADIARAADVSEGSIFYHFGSKRNLLADIGRMYGESMIEAMRRDDALEDLEPGIILNRAFEFCIQHREWEKITGNERAVAGKAIGMKNPEAEPFYHASRDVVVAWTALQHQVAHAKHGGPKMHIPLASALTYALVGHALEALQLAENATERQKIIDESIRYVRAAYGYDGNGKPLTCL